jgi:hypothetical protein
MAKKTFEFWYDEVYTYKAWIEADSQEEADELINQVESGDLDINALPKFQNKDKGYTLTIGQLTEETN